TACGQQKIQSEQKNARKQAGLKKKQEREQKATAEAVIISTCIACRTQCQTLRPSHSTLRASVLRLHFFQNWLMFKH
uniref:Small EDRK-rich factor-like N-terminal domain-containing protein n=1 Tax=Oryctolagus cuniculus TaxID=9986 RepID=A0A5F9DJ21_RABIT